MLTDYQPLEPDDMGVWFKEAELGLGLWQGVYQGAERLWLRWYDGERQWIPTPTEIEKQRAEQEKQRADLAEQENIQLRERLLQAGLEP